MNSYTSTKSYYNYPCCHRQWRHAGHCSYVHGYSRSFHFQFQCQSLDEHGFVMDFGGLKPLKDLLDHWFDHTLLLNADDPLLPQFQALHAQGACDLRILPNCSMEGSALFLHGEANRLLRELTGGRVWCTRVEVRENDKNSAWFEG